MKGWEWEGKAILKRKRQDNKILIQQIFIGHLIYIRYFCASGELK